MFALGVAFADDGALVRKSMAPAPGNAPSVPAGYIPEAEHAFIDMMKFYVPMQAADGTVAPIEYNNIDDVLVETRETAKPLVGVYIYGPSEGVEGVGFVGHGKREVYGAVSLDDGLTYKVTNLSESADLTSSNVIRDDVPLFANTEYAYPGDVINVFQATAGNKTLAVWPSRYCSGGSPNYSLPSNPTKLLAVANSMGIDLGMDPINPTKPSPDDLYLIDMFGVGGQQSSVDYSKDKFEQNQAVGVVPFACLWTARGVLVQGDDPRTGANEQSYMRWFKAERLTSGRRDVNRVEAKCVAGAGCAITWQEDPEGLRGGQGEGPGEGWSGAVANSQTDVWYAYLNWEHFDLVEDPTDDTGGAIIPLAEYENLTAGETTITQKPQVGIPFSMPMRITDNARCNVTNPQPYCNGSAIYDEQVGGLNPLDYGMVDMCADTVQIPTGRQGRLSDICVTEYGLPLVGNIAATRPRLGLFGYDSDKDDIVDSAFVVFEAEESKGLGAFGFDSETSDTCDPEESDTCIAFDEGKNLWYYSFNMELTGDNDGNFSSKLDLDSLLANLGGHGNQLNQPEVDWTRGEFYPVANTASFWDFGDYNYEIWNTEIARRGSLLDQDSGLLAQDIDKALKSKSRLVALPSWKQGIMNQGGPADVMARRILFKVKNWKPKDGNPYAFRNMDCNEWKYGRGKQNGKPENAYYPDGLCMDSAINLSGFIPDTCTDSQGEPDNRVACPNVNWEGSTTFGKSDTNPVLQGADVDANTTKVLTWHQCPAEFSTVSGATLDCSTDGREDPNDNKGAIGTLADQSWYNPLDVAKGHRGFLDGDFVMLLYAWSPNWRLNAVGNDRYELYIRRSFDGGATWTTLPANYKHWDNDQYDGAGTVTCETFRSADTGSGDIVEPRVCNQYEPGASEQARNVTQLKSMATTTLDPRYAPTMQTITADPFGVGIRDPEGEDLRDPSRFFIVYETGDNTTTALGEPEPLDLFYSRAVAFGDDYQVWAEETDLNVCYPSDPHEVTDVPPELISSGFCNEFDQVDEGRPGVEGSEASLEANPSGEFMYGVWAQLDVEADTEESDPVARRVWWIDDFISDTNAWTLPGTAQGTGED
ncbi:hypothetical protein CCR96_22650 [Halochromatium roseum]|nr:hypothetical protein [Halochromatium roseum]